MSTTSNDNTKALEALEQALADVKRNTWDYGTVIRWQSSGRYTYAALKTPIGWVTTSREGNGYVPKQLTYEQLVKVLSRSETSDVAVASGWFSL